MELYVGNLPDNFSENELKSLFKPYRFKKLRIEKESGKSGLSGFVEVSDIAAVIKAVRECDGMMVKGRKIQVCDAAKREQISKAAIQKEKAASAPKEKHFSDQKRKPSLDSKGNFSSGQKRNFSSAPKEKSQDSQPSGRSGKGGEFPYRFCKRKTVKIKPSAYHDKLNDGNYDIAFEIAWTALTPAALNPCTDITEKATMPENNDSEFAAYNKRWLMPEDHLLISPFTVKSAIANGFANVMGGCYRVNTKKDEGHRKVEQGQYPYPGGYKRYRADMGNSKPGIVEKKEKVNGNKFFEIELKKVEEYYYDHELPFSLKRDDTVYVTLKPRGNKPAIIQKLSAKPLQSEKDVKKVKYFGEYTEGMGNQPSRKHRHRFYSETGEVLSGSIPDYNFNSLKELENLVYMGQFNHNPNKRWYQDLRNIKKGDWIYYQTMDERISAIGLNFQFKAMFFHEDAVPEDGKLCGSKDLLCPRCRMFGMTEEKQDNKNRESAALKGRFKASALRNVFELKPGNPESFPIPGLNQRVSLKTWVDSQSGKRLAYQALMPIAGSPKPNKRDINGYFDKSTGQIKGAKVYKHGKLDSAKNISGVDTNPPSEYKHSLRNYAMVCEPELVFTGTVGAENASPEEISALIVLLDSSVKNHGFKLGLGKAFGMGSFSSAITKVWIRRKQEYEWKTMENWKSIEQCFPDIQNEISLLKKLEDFKINATTGWKDRNLEYPPPVAEINGRRTTYWNMVKW